MNIIITVREALEEGIWDDLCDLKDWNVRVINEGVMDGSEEITLTFNEARSLNLIPTYTKGGKR